MKVLLDCAISGDDVPYVAMLGGEWGVMHAGAGLKRKAAEQLSGPAASIRRMETALKGISQVMGTALRKALLLLAHHLHLLLKSWTLCLLVWTAHMSTLQAPYSPVILASDQPLH